MANHLTPEEISKEFGIERKEVIRICVREHVPIYHGKIDKTCSTRCGTSRRPSPARTERHRSARSPRNAGHEAGVPR